MDVEKMLKYFNSEEVIKKFERMEQQKEKDMQYVKSNIFLDWLKQFITNHNNEIVSDDYMYLYPEEQNFGLIGSFVDYVEELAEQQRVMNVLDEENYFQTLNYAIRIDDDFYKVSQMHGQGCVDIIESIEKPNYCYVKVR